MYISLNIKALGMFPQVVKTTTRKTFMISLRTIYDIFIKIDRIVFLSLYRQQTIYIEESFYK